MDTEEEKSNTFALFHQLSCDPIHLVFSFASFQELSIYCNVSSEWNRYIVANNWLWTILCQSYWSNKYIPTQYRKLLKSSQIYEAKDEKLASECPARKAFRLAYNDRVRTTMTVDELISFKWYFRFKEEAGESWLQIDPFWNLEISDIDSNDSDSDNDNDNDNDDDNDNDNDDDDVEELNQYKPEELVGILTDDEIAEFKLKQQKYQQFARQKSLGDVKKKEALSEHEKRLLRCTRIKFERDGSMEYIGNSRLKHMLNTQEFKWSFDGIFYKNKLFGDAIQYHSYPKKYVSRHSNNWSFILQSYWVIYTSFPMPELHSNEERLIINNCGSQQAMQYNYIDQLFQMHHQNEEEYDDIDATKLIDEEEMFDLEYLKEIKSIAMSARTDNTQNETMNGYCLEDLLQLLRYTE